MGLYRIKYHNMAKTYILVMKNAHPPDLHYHAICDLKGRKPKPGKLVKPSFEYSGRPIKDNEMIRGLNFKYQRDVKEFKSRIIKDSNFLKEQNLMDYSLLVGVHKVPKPSEKLLNRLYKRGGFQGTDPHTNEVEFYFFGIIDCLTSYILKKKMANMIKRFIWTNDTLSTVESEYYAERFQQFMTNDLLSERGILTKIDDPELIKKLKSG